MRAHGDYHYATRNIYFLYVVLHVQMELNSFESTGTMRTGITAHCVYRGIRACTQGSSLCYFRSYMGPALFFLNFPVVSFHCFKFDVDRCSPMRFDAVNSECTVHVHENYH